jgi:hypothetical protein
MYETNNHSSCEVSLTLIQATAERYLPPTATSRSGSLLVFIFRRRGDPTCVSHNYTNCTLRCGVTLITRLLAITGEDNSNLYCPIATQHCPRHTHLHSIHPTAPPLTFHFHLPPNNPNIAKSITPPAHHYPYPPPTSLSSQSVQPKAF